MLYRLSQIIPVRFTTDYREGGRRLRTVWWQWRDRPFAIHTTAA